MNKNILILLITVMTTMATHGQEKDSTINQLYSAKGQAILPEKGDIAIGIDASPLFNLIGNMVKINSSTAFNDPSSFAFVNSSNAIYGKYFLSGDKALRAKIRIASFSNKETGYVYDDTYQGDPADYNKGAMDKKDELTSSYSTVTLGLGYEMRRGYNRLRGYYGAECLVMLGSGSASSMNMKYDYGNEMTEDVTMPTVYDFTTNTTTNTSSRTTKVKQGSTLGLGARGFIGAEYFILPKISIGGEFGWGFNFITSGDVEVTTEQWDANAGEVETVGSKKGNDAGFILDTDNMSGQLYLLLHF